MGPTCAATMFVNLFTACHTPLTLIRISKYIIWMKYQLPQADYIKAVKQQLMGFIMDEIVNSVGEFHDDGGLIPRDELSDGDGDGAGGTRWLGRARACAADAAVVAQLRACGAVLAGKTNMHELGAGTSGINPHHGSTRNPHNPGRVSGGSSSGSAAAVCAGLCPVALGVDGGGSVRMPAALCGVVGFKPTAGRLSNAGVLPLNWTPELNLPLLKSSLSIKNIKLAKYAKWFNDSSEDIRNCCDKSLQMLHAHYGWETLDVTIPEIEEMRLAHYVTIGSECTASLAKYLDKLRRSEIGWDVRVALGVYGSFSSRAYLNSQRLRNRQMYFHKEIFKTADVIVSPMTGVTAYKLQDDALKSGELDYINGAALVRYSIAGNFLGLPAITVMVGYDKAGLPIGLQFIGRPWRRARSTTRSLKCSTISSRKIKPMEDGVTKDFIISN
uniref:Amidase domain-containing protein n=1 Tax=Oryza meridionalis TaxID=40149 RepID=A0A0E0F8Q1_9ORYZ